jgi:hypothetical protein
VEQRFCRGFCEFRCAERGELAGKTWWSCGESVAGNNSKSGPQGHAIFLHIFKLNLATLDADWVQQLSLGRQARTDDMAVVTSVSDSADEYFHAGFVLNA